MLAACLGVSLVACMGVCSILVTCILVSSILPSLEPSLQGRGAALHVEAREIIDSLRDSENAFESHE